MRELPRWVWDMLADLVRYEDTHGHPHDGWPCLESTLSRVPHDVLNAAEVIAQYRVVDAEIVQEKP
jgi:hypothetical protein